MSLKICGHLFYGPFEPSQTQVRSNQIPVVYAVVCREGAPWNPVFRLLDVGHSGSEGLRFVDHPNALTWKQSCDGKLGIYLLDAPADEGFDEAKRRAVADSIRANLAPPNDLIPIHAI